MNNENETDDAFVLSIKMDCIDDTAMIYGENGTYLDLIVMKHRGGPRTLQLGNGRTITTSHFAIQKLPRDRHQAGERSQIVANGHPWRTRATMATDETQTRSTGGEWRPGEG